VSLVPHSCLQRFIVCFGILLWVILWWRMGLRASSVDIEGVNRWVPSGVGEASGRRWIVECLCSTDSASTDQLKGLSLLLDAISHLCIMVLAASTVHLLVDRHVRRHPRHRAIQGQMTFGEGDVHAWVGTML